MKLINQGIQFILILLLTNCNNSDVSNTSAYLKKISDFEKDSNFVEMTEFILCTSSNWIEHTHLYKYGNYKNQVFTNRVPFIYTNSAKSKFVAILTTKYLKDSLYFNDYPNPLDSFTYAYQMIIGVFENDTVLAYPMQIKLGYGEVSWTSAAIDAMRFLEEEIANRRISANNVESQSVTINYNINDDHFWSSVLFTKGIRVEGLYYFQNHQNATNTNPKEIELPPNNCYK